MSDFFDLVYGENQDRIKLSDVQAITLYKDSYTTGRRASRIPQVFYNKCF
jgi:hypothetical protein